MAASKTSFPRNVRFARIHASPSPMTSANAVEMTATRKLSHNGNQSSGIGISHVSAGRAETSQQVYVLILGELVKPQVEPGPARPSCSRGDFAETPDRARQEYNTNH